MKRVSKEKKREILTIKLYCILTRGAVLRTKSNGTIVLYSISKHSSYVIHEIDTDMKYVFPFYLADRFLTMYLARLDIDSYTVL
jgi:hypothetical protein